MMAKTKTKTKKGLKRMTILDKAKRGEEPIKEKTPINESKETPKETSENKTTKPDAEVVSDSSQMLSAVESQFNVSIVLLLSYIRYCINHGLKKDITIKIGYNKPAAIPMNFAVNEELLEEIFPGDVVEIN